MNYGEIKYVDIANGIGVRVSLFVSGCRNHCPHCFNEMTWAFNYGKKYTKEVEDDILEHLSKSYVEGLTILGGEPFEPENQEGILNLIKRVREELPSKDIWIYTGFTLEELLEGTRASTPLVKDILKNIDVLVDGRFVEALKDITLKFRGSSNQRLIDVKETIKNNRIDIYFNSHEQALQFGLKQQEIFIVEEEIKNGK